MGVARQSTAAQISSYDYSKNWRVVEHGDIKELNLESTLLEHKVTKTKFLHMACDDSNNALSINFRTTPTDSTGVAHILEHTALCGSPKFPTRDPFMKMLNRSLSTFMNAMTGPDYTMYIFSTCNQQDYANLMNVYLDSAFNPLLREQDFLQEGWRLENDDLADSESPFVIKGVVFNEMKGYYSDSQGLFNQKLVNNMLPGHTYGNSSGGFPLDIPSLSWEQLKEFHAKHYHPSNAKIISYGDYPLEKHLEMVDSYLEPFTYLEMDTSVPSQKRWDAPRRNHVECAPDALNTNPDKQTTVAVSYLMTDITDLKESFVLQVLGELLMGGPSAPFYKSLIQSGIGSEFAPSSGFDGHMKDTSYTIGLQNIAESEVDKVLSIIDQTIDEVIEEGFPEERIQAVIHSVELALKHRSSNFGISLIMGMTPYWNHSDAPIDFLRTRYNENISEFKALIQNDPEYLQKKMKSYFKNNKHKLVQTMTPNEGFLENQEKEFESLEEKLRAGLTPESKQVIREKCLQLSESQDMKEDVSCLPTLHVKDIKDEFLSDKVDHLTLAGVPVQVSLQPCNHVSYFRAQIDTSSVPTELKPYLPLFADCLSQLGAKDYSYQDLDTKIELSTGGLGTSCNVIVNPNNLEHVEESLLLTSYCLDTNLERMMELWAAIFEDLHLNNIDRLSTLVRMNATNTSNGIAYMGHRYAMSCAAASVSSASAVTECQSGMEHVNLLAQLSTTNGADLMEKFKVLAGLLLNKKSMKVALNCIPQTEQRFIKVTEDYLTDLSSGADAPKEIIQPTFKVRETKTHHVVPFPINFTSQAFPTVPFTHPDAAKLKVLSRLLSSKYLHQAIREKGGAYGGGATAGSGTFTFYSYRDPKNLETFSAYRGAAEWGAEGAFDDQDIDEAKLGVFQQLDVPTQPGYRGLRHFLSGVTDEQFAEHRIRVKRVTREDLIAVSERYLVGEGVSGRALIGPAQTGLEDLGWTTSKFQVQ